ncbi:MAG: hypothetical protein U1F42_04675 [Candidatus Competibacteraceae bacterium]
MNAMLDKVKTFLYPTPVQMAGGPPAFAAWLEANSAAFSNSGTIWPTLADLEHTGIPPELFSQLQGAGGRWRGQSLWRRCSIGSLNCGQRVDCRAQPAALFAPGSSGRFPSRWQQRWKRG